MLPGDYIDASTRPQRPQPSASRQAQAVCPGCLRLIALIPGYPTARGRLPAPQLQSNQLGRRPSREAKASHFHHRHDSLSRARQHDGYQGQRCPRRTGRLPLVVFYRLARPCRQRRVRFLSWRQRLRVVFGRPQLPGHAGRGLVLAAHQQAAQRDPHQHLRQARRHIRPVSLYAGIQAMGPQRRRPVVAPPCLHQLEKP